MGKETGTMTEKIKLLHDKFGDRCIGQVIRILDKYTLIINVGRDRISVGDIIQVFYHGEQIIDLDGTPLGNYEYEKGKFDVIQVEEQYSICKTHETAESKLALVTSPLLEKTRTPMNTAGEEITPFQNIDPNIHVGDPVKKP